jgi:lipopolysaccharide export system protein LptC
MSELAIRERSARQMWARPGGSHDWFVRGSKILLPIGIGGLLAYLLFAPLANTDGDVSFVLAKDTVALAKERLRVTKAVYRGEDSQGRAFELSAGSAVQRTSREPIIRVSDIAATMNMAEGPAKMTAKNANYDMDREVISVIGPVTFQTADGYRLDMTNVAINLKSRIVSSASGVGGVVPRGNFNSTQIAANIKTRQVTMAGGVQGNTPLGSFAGSQLSADLASRRVAVSGGVSGQTRIGSYRANSVVVDQRAGTIVLDGQASMVINR